MKGSKSKSKSKKVAEQPVQTDQKLTTKASTPKNQGKKKVIHLNYLRGRVSLNIGSLDQKLQRALIKSIDLNQQRMKYYSLLLELKISKKGNQEIIYEHKIDTKQAISLYNHLMSKKLSESDIVQQLKAMSEIVKQYNIEGLTPSVNPFNDKIQELRKGIKKLYPRQKQARSQQYETDPTNEDKIKSSLLINKIKKLTVSLLKQTIVTLRQITNSNKVQIIFQQSYPEKTCTIRFLKSIIGQEIYNEKKVNFVRFYSENEHNFKTNRNFIVCHQCKNLITGHYARCKNQDKQLKDFKQSYKNSVHIYHKNLVAFDYCYHKISNQTVKIKEQLECLSYFSRFGKKYCFRFTCLSCMSKQKGYQLPIDMKQYTCSFCREACTSKSYTIAQQILKCLALFKHILMRNYQSQDMLYKLINYVNLNSDQIEVQLNLRCSFSQLRSRNYSDYYKRLKQEFLQIDKAYDEYQQQILNQKDFRSNGLDKLYEDDYMRKVRQYMAQQKRKQADLIKDERLLKDGILQKVYRLRQKNSRDQFQMQQRDKMMVSNKKNKHQNSKYAVKTILNDQYQPPKHIQYSDSIKYYSKQQNQYQMINLKSIREDKDIQKLAEMSSFAQNLPFTQQDYEADMNVPERCIIHNQLTLSVESLIKRKIIMNLNDKSLFWKMNQSKDYNKDQNKKVSYQKSSEFIEQCIYEIQNWDFEQQDESQFVTQQFSGQQSNLSSFSVIPRYDYLVQDDKQVISMYEYKQSDSLMIVVNPSQQQSQFNEEQYKKNNELKLQNQGYKELNTRQEIVQKQLVLQEQIEKDNYQDQDSSQEESLMQINDQQFQKKL